MKKLILLLVALTLAIPAIAADVNGNWRGTVSTSKGDFPISFTFKVTGTRLEGTMLGTDGTPFQIDQGTVDGENLTFAVTLSYPGKSLQRSYRGVIRGDEIQFTVDSNAEGSKFVV